MTSRQGCTKIFLGYMINNTKDHQTKNNLFMTTQEGLLKSIQHILECLRPGLSPLYGFESQEIDVRSDTPGHEYNTWCNKRGQKHGYLFSVIRPEPQGTPSWNSVGRLLQDCVILPLAKDLYGLDDMPLAQGAVFSTYLAHTLFESDKTYFYALAWASAELYDFVANWFSPTVNNMRVFSREVQNIVNPVLRLFHDDIPHIDDDLAVKAKQIAIVEAMKRYQEILQSQRYHEERRKRRDEESLPSERMAEIREKLARSARLLEKDESRWVFHPAIPCFGFMGPEEWEEGNVEGSYNYKRLASKVFQDDKDAAREWTMALFVSKKIDKPGEFTVQVRKYCKANIRNLKGEELTKAGFFGYEDKQQLIYNYDGQIKLHDDALRIPMKSFEVLVTKGLKKIAAGALCHQNISPHTVVFVEGTCKLTDFGHARHMTNVYRNSNKKYLERASAYLPPECALFAKMSIPESKSIMGDTRRMKKAHKFFEDQRELMQRLFANSDNRLNAAAMLRFAVNKLDTYSLGATMLTAALQGKIVDLNVNFINLAIAMMDPVVFRRPCPAACAALWKGVTNEEDESRFLDVLRTAQMIELKVFNQYCGSFTYFGPALSTELSKIMGSDTGRMFVYTDSL